eukprot:1893464-Rhodomonas_salina.3
MGRQRPGASPHPSQDESDQAPESIAAARAGRQSAISRAKSLALLPTDQTRGPLRAAFDFEAGFVPARSRVRLWRRPRRYSARLQPASDPELACARSIPAAPSRNSRTCPRAAPSAGTPGRWRPEFEVRTMSELRLRVPNAKPHTLSYHDRVVDVESKKKCPQTRRAYRAPQLVFRQGHRRDIALRMRGGSLDAPRGGGRRAMCVGCLEGSEQTRRRGVRMDDGWERSIEGGGRCDVGGRSVERKVRGAVGGERVGAMGGEGQSRDL